MSAQKKINADSKNIKSLLKGEKFYIDYFQREYRWKEKHIELFIDDITSAFLMSYKQDHKRTAVGNYQNYYLGPVVFSINSDSRKKSIIDGQQRITSITLFLIYLNHLQKNNEQKVAIEELIFSETYGEKSFNITDETRQSCLKGLFEEGNYKIEDDDDESIRNIVARYADIELFFPEEQIQIEVLPYFIDWFIENVVVIDITANSDENAYLIFETMNDRGLNLTLSEMLKGYVLSKITEEEKRIEINDIWKEQVKQLHSWHETADQSFFQAWFRGKYADDTRQGQDFELIGSQFHSWFKDKHKQLFKLETSDEFYQFFKIKFPFYVKWYLKSWEHQTEYNKNVPHLYYINYWGIAESLQDALLLSSIMMEDDDATIEKKLDFTARYIETFTVRKAINYKKFGQASIKYTMFHLTRSIRDNGLVELAKNFPQEIKGSDLKWDAIQYFGLHGKNRKFVKHLLSRISEYADELAGKDSTYAGYQNPQKGKEYEIEHIWGNKFDEHKDEFDQESEFQRWRNSIGALILLPNRINQSFNSDEYKEKVKHYIKQNTYAQTLNSTFYEKNPIFLKSPRAKNLNFKAHDDFKKQDVLDRQQLVQQICEQLWSTNYFDDASV